MSENNPLVEIRGKVALVTGAGRGLGRTISLGMAREGANVVVCGRTMETVKETVALIEAEGGTAVPFEFEATNEKDCASVVEFAVEAYGVLDIAVINHGITVHDHALTMSAEDFRKVVDVNLSSAFLCAREAARAMSASGRGGSIVMISSNASIVAYEGLIAYSSSKGGLDMLGRQLALELAPHSIRVNIVAPGYMNSHMRGTEAGYEDTDFLEKMKTKVPAGRRGEPEELVGAIVFFASDAASYVTGQYISVDGGYTIV